MKQFIGHLNGTSQRIAIVVSRFNEFITSQLLNGAIDTLKRHGVADQDIEVAWVPGAFEIPFVAKKMALSLNYEAVICLGAVIKGATPHFDFVAGQSASAIARLAYEGPCPVIYGILTTNTIEEAIERAGTKVGNKGCDSAIAAIEMINLHKELDLSMIH